MAEVTARIDEKSLKHVRVKIKFDLTFEQWLELEKILPTNYEGNRFRDLIEVALLHLRETFNEYVAEDEGREG